MRSKIAENAHNKGRALLDLNTLNALFSQFYVVRFYNVVYSFIFKFTEDIGKYIVPIFRTVCARNCHYRLILDQLRYANSVDT